jgi:hypothetical protein
MENTYKAYDLRRINNLFKDLFEKRDPNYFENKLDSGEATSPLSYFLKTYLECNIKDLYTYRKIKSSSDENYYVFVTEKVVAVSKDYEDPCELNFCVQKNPIVLSLKLEKIENVAIQKGDKFQLILNMSTTTDLKGNIM